jgi:hypothetical protein
MNDTYIFLPFIILFFIAIIIGVTIFVQSWFRPQQFLDKMRKRAEKYPQMEMLFNHNIILWIYRIFSIIFLLMTLLMILTIILSIFFEYPPV